MIDTMAATIGNGGSPRILRSGTGDIAAATPAGLRRIVVPVDGSPFAERALPVATWVAQAIFNADAPGRGGVTPGWNRVRRSLPRRTGTAQRRPELGRGGG